jgi:signal peptidase I
MALQPYQRWYLYLGLVFVLILSQMIYEALHPRPSSAYSIPSGAMVPTLLVGDYVQGARYKDREPQRGDVATYLVPPDGLIYVKRIVGLPGDRVQMREGRLYLNDTLVPREAVEGLEVPEGASLTIYRETLPDGVSHLIAEISDHGPFDDTEPTVVPPGQYFLLGDNRDNSRDSRVMGPAAREQVLSRLFYLFWSRDLGRIGLAVQ